MSVVLILVGLEKCRPKKRLTSLERSVRILSMINKGLLTDAADAHRYISAGHGRITLRSVKTGTGFTYKFRTPRDEHRPQDQSDRRPIFVSLLNGSDNETAYQYLGCLWERDGKLSYAHGRKSRTTADAPSVRAFAWAVAHIEQGNLPEILEVWHEGVCGKCGRALTVPESVERGIGPDCWSRMAA